jgi:hypothetical protein
MQDVCILLNFILALTLNLTLAIMLFFILALTYCHSEALAEESRKDNGFFSR